MAAAVGAGLVVREQLISQLDVVCLLGQARLGGEGKADHEFLLRLTCTPRTLVLPHCTLSACWIRFASACGAGTIQRTVHAPQCAKS
jgi:hypothetical protein